MRCCRSEGVWGKRYVPSGGTYLGGCVAGGGTQRLQNVSGVDVKWAKTSGGLTYWGRSVCELVVGWVGLEGEGREGVGECMAEICHL